MYQQQYYPATSVEEEEIIYEVPQQKKKLFRNPFKAQHQVVQQEEVYEYPSQEESYTSYESEQPSYVEEQPSYQEEQHHNRFWRKQQKKLARQQEQQYQQQYQQPEQYSSYSDQSQSDYSDSDNESGQYSTQGMSLKQKLWRQSKPFIIKSATTLFLSTMLPPKYVPMARNMIYKVFGIPVTPSGAHTGRLGGILPFGHHEEMSSEQQYHGQQPQAYVGKRKVGKATFRKVLLLGSGLAVSGLSALLAWKFLLKPKFGKNIYSNEPKSVGKIEKNEDLDEQLAYQQGGSRMVERIKKSPYGIKGSPAVLEKKTRTTKRYEVEVPVVEEEEVVYVDETRPALFGQLKNEIESRNI